MGIVKKRKVLTREEEISLFETLRDENTSAEEKKRIEETLVLRNMGLVVKEARRFASNGSIPMEDLVQEGAKGLVRTIRKFDTESGCKFSTYATYWIKRDIGRMVRTKSGVIHVPEHTSEAARKAKTVIARFEADHGRKPTPKEFADLSGIDPDKAKEALEAVQKPVSIHTPVGDDGDAELGDLIEDRNVGEPSDPVIESESSAMLKEAVRRLSPVERAILALRYGVMSIPMTRKSIARTFMVPEQAVPA